MDSLSCFIAEIAKFGGDMCILILSGRSSRGGFIISSHVYLGIPKKER
jgi:hypothetical protein